MSAIDKEPFPRLALLAAAALVGLALVAAGAGRFTDLNAVPESNVAHRAPAVSLSMSFVDDANGAVRILDNDTGDLVTILEPGTNGFVRSVVRGLVRDRRSRGIDRAPPFMLSQWENGTLILEDTATGKRIDLRAFGPTNKEAFARILQAKSLQ